MTESHRQTQQYLLLTHAEQMVKAVVLGPYKALAKRNDSWDGVDFDRLHAACVAWFGEIFEFFGGHEVLADQSRVIRSVPVRVALASLNSAHYDDRAEDKATLTLKEVDWLVSEIWTASAARSRSTTTASLACRPGPARRTSTVPCKR